MYRYQRLSKQYKNCAVSGLLSIIGVPALPITYLMQEAILPFTSLSNTNSRVVVTFFIWRCVCTSDLLPLHKLARQRDDWLRRPVVRGVFLYIIVLVV